MYEELFNSPHRPFRATPDAKFYFPHDSIESARQTVVRVMVRAEGPAMVLGGAGLGKSLLSQIIADDLGERLDIVRLHAARLCSRRALLQNILFELKMPYRDLSEGELRLSILDRLEPSPETAPDGVLILVDEAHTLHSKLLDELRLITNFTRNNQPRTRLVLIGSLRLEDTFAEPQMDSFNQRLAARCYLQPMSRQQTHQYVRHQLNVAGVKPPEFITNDGLDAVYAASEGVPRLVNQIMDHTLVLAVANNQCPVSSPLVEEAWADLQQLPAPWHSASEQAQSAAAAAIEYGSLDDADDEFLSDADTSDQVVDIDTTDSEHSTESVAAAPALTDGPLEEPFDGQIEAEETPATELEPEPPEEPEQEPAQENFFAAFSPAPAEEAQPLTILADTETSEPAEELVRPRVIFDASVDSSLPQEAESQSSQAPDSLPIDSFFTNRPTDEKILALEDEQDQYDAMGVWENDPPLNQHSPLPKQPHRESRDAYEELEQRRRQQDSSAHSDQSPVPSSESDTRHLVPMSDEISQTSAEDLFGDDFDEELAIPSTYEPVSELKLQDDGDSQTDAQRQAAAAEYVEHIQCYAESIVSAHQEELVGEMGEAAGAAEPAVDSGEQVWSLDISSLDVQSELAVHDEIEDLVSQLNFSDFSVEPFSVEQISVEASQQPTAAPIQPTDRDEIYTLRPGQSQGENHIFDYSAAEYDDDRDMLVIEEELPVSSRMTDAASDKPVTKTAPYGQLFAKLRQ